MVKKCVKQQYHNDCGAACLQNAAIFLELPDTTLEEFQNLCGHRADFGVTFGRLRGAAERGNLEADLVRRRLKLLRRETFPVIVALTPPGDSKGLSNHFVLLESYCENTDRFLVNDPAPSKETEWVAADQLHYTGDALLLRRSQAIPIPPAALQSPLCLLAELMRRAGKFAWICLGLRTLVLLMGVASYITFRFLFGTFYQQEADAFINCGRVLIAIRMMRFCVSRTVEKYARRIKSNWKRRLIKHFKTSDTHAGPTGNQPARKRLKNDQQSAILFPRSIYSVCEAAEKLLSMIPDALLLIGVIALISMLAPLIGLALILVLLVTWASSFLIAQTERLNYPDEVRDEITRCSKFAVELIAITGILLAARQLIGRLDHMEVLTMVFAVVIAIPPLARLRTAGDLLLEIRKSTRLLQARQKQITEIEIAD